MSFLLPLVALALAALSRLAFRDREPLVWRFDLTKALSLIVLVVIAAGVAARFAPDLDRSGVMAGLIVGAIAALLGEVVGGSVAPIAIGVAAAAAMHALKHTTVPAAELALMLGAGLGALTYGREGAMTTALVATLCATTDNLGGRHLEMAGAGILGSEVGLAVAIGALLSGWVPVKFSGLKPVVVGGIAVAGACVVAKKLNATHYLDVAAIGAVSGMVLHWLIPNDEESDSVRIGLATVIGIGIATITFGLARGVGMAIALVAAAGILLAVGNRRAVLTLGPLVGLVMYRVLREAGTGATRALDIGQHYALLGIVLGAVIPLLPSDWRATEGAKRASGMLLWGLVAIAVPPVLIVMLGMKGVVGFVAGLGVTGLCQALRREAGLLPLVLAGGMAGGTILGLGWMSAAEEMARDDKVHFFVIAGIGFVIAGGILALLSRNATGTATATEGGK